MGSERACARCPALEREVSRLQREVARLKRQNQALSELVSTIYGYVLTMLNESGRTLSKQSGVPRGRWSFERGTFGIADTIRQIIEDRTTRGHPGE